MNSDVVSPHSVSTSSVDEGNELDLRELFGVLWNGKLAITIGVAVALLIGVLYLIAARPAFTADGLVQVERGDKGGGAAVMGELASLLGDPTETSAEVEILQSRMILTRVIKALNLEIEAEPRYFPLFGRYIARMRAGLDQPASALLGLRRFAWGGEIIEVTGLEVPPALVGQPLTLIAIGNDAYQLLDSDGDMLLSGETGKTSSGSGVELFVQDMRARPGTQFQLIRYPLSSVLAALGKTLVVAEQGKQSGIISLTYEDYSPQRVADVIRQIEDAYVRQNVERRSAQAEQSLEFLQKQLPEIRANVDAAQARLNAYQLKQGSVNITKETDLVLQQAVSLEAKRLELQQQRQQVLQRFTEQHPAVQSIDAQIAGINSNLEDIKKKTENLPETQQEVLSLMRDLEVNTQIYTTLLNSMQELQVAKAGTVGSVRIVDYPLVPRSKSKPNSALVLAVAMLLGGFSGVVYLFARRMLFHGVSRPDELERGLGISTYAAIPFSPLQRRLAIDSRRAGAGGSQILAVLDSSNVAVEALRSFRTSLQFALLEASNNIVMFTGPTPGLGKSFVSINLGAVLANGGKKIVIIDGDLRRGYLHKYIDATAAPGLSDYVAGNADLGSILRSTGVEGLSVIPNGTTPPNPAELLMHERFVQLLEKLSREYDLVIIDTPPILPVTDASIVGRLVGSVFIILKEGEHPLRMIEESVRRLRQAGVQVNGAVFNQVGVGGGGYGYGYYSSYGYSYKKAYRSKNR